MLPVGGDNAVTVVDLVLSRYIETGRVGIRLRESQSSARAAGCIFTGFPDAAGAGVSSQLPPRSMAGRMLWLNRNRLAGSYLSLTATSRSYFPGPQAARTASLPASAMKLL